MPTTEQLQSPDERLTHILDTGAVSTHVQPVVSLRRKSLVAVEALSRGHLPEGAPLEAPRAGSILPDNSLLDATGLFSLPVTPEDRLALDKLCRRRALEAFGPLRKRVGGLVLFLNLHPDCLDHHSANTSHLAGQVQRAGLEPAHVVVETAPRASPELLREFVRAHRDAGFLVSLDNMGSRPEDFELLETLRPDVVKLSPGLSGGAGGHSARLELVQGMLRLAGACGAVTIACGTEQQQDVQALAELGLDLFQGHAFARAVEPAEALPDLGQTLENVAHMYRDHCIRTLATRRERHKVYAILAEQLLEELSAPDVDLEGCLRSAVESHPVLVCAYVLTGSGLQISPSVCKPEHTPPAAAGRGSSGALLAVDNSAGKGADHSYFEYFLALSAGLTRYTTDAGLSPASRRLVRTIAATYQDARGRERVLCLDMDATHDG